MKTETETEVTFEKSHHRGVPILISSNKREDTRKILVRRCVTKNDVEVFEINKFDFISEWLQLVFKLSPIYGLNDLTKSLDEIIADTRFAAGSEFERIYAKNLIEIERGHGEDKTTSELPQIRVKRGVIQ